ncbi:MAG: tRNA 2-thiouridine(34) synthase MnmA [Candidatus Cloacimonetes bacterium]|nr:tRNA 2-thiouridine(34) synthase MnmA [Candidatus Cloacimonadota bacterium]
MKKKIAVALSGGIDSSAAAWLLLQKGYEIAGVTMRHFNDQDLGFVADNGIEGAVLQAERVCNFLGIPHIVIDLREVFSKIVMTDFIAEYKRGRTPNPCVLCNRTIKWGAFLEQIRSLGFDLMATGHYINKLKTNGLYHLYRSGDLRKDQSYMLWQLNQQQLAQTIFPLGEMNKSQARDIITNNNIPVKTDVESQEICFISGHYREFLEKHLVLKPGDIVLCSGEKIGEHLGLPLYTIGQRKGIHTSLNEVLFVKKLNMTENSMLVTNDPDELFCGEFQIRKVNWIAGPPDSNDPDLLVQIRYNSGAVEVASLQCMGDSLLVKLTEPARAVTPGQSAVFYRNNELLGGGVID